MKTIHVRSSSGAYAIHTGSGLLKKSGHILRSLGLSGKVLIVTQEKIATLHLSKVQKSLAGKGFAVHVHLVPDGESAKSEKELFRLFHTLIDKDFERRDTLFALGGGVVGDVTGFAAATYLRGVPFINAGTTLLAQVDSSIGGKTGINLEAGKNLVGAFYPPKAVISDIETLKTLLGRELQASLGEVIKYGVIKDAKLFGFLEKNIEKILAKDPASLEKIVSACAAIKAGVVTRDEHETKGERMILNFGHTFGHGVEKALNYRRLMHGEAVAVGMICAAELAVALKKFSTEEVFRLKRLVRAFHLPVSLSGLDIATEDILEAMGRDKKKKAGKLRFVLPERIGKVTVREGISLGLVKKIISKMEDPS